MTNIHCKSNLVQTRNQKGEENSQEPHAKGVDWHQGIINIGYSSSHFRIWELAIVFCWKGENGGKDRSKAHSLMLIAPLPSLPTYLLVVSPSTTGMDNRSWERSKFGSFKGSMMNSASFWMSGMLHVWTLLTCFVEEVQGLASISWVPCD